MAWAGLFLPRNWNLHAADSEYYEKATDLAAANTGICYFRPNCHYRAFPYDKQCDRLRNGNLGLVGQIMTYQTMVATESPVLVILKIVVFHFLLPGLLSYVIYRGMRNMGYIKDGQMKLSV